MNHIATVYMIFRSVLPTNSTQGLERHRPDRPGPLVGVGSTCTVTVTIESARHGNVVLACWQRRGAIVAHLHQRDAPHASTRLCSCIRGCGTGRAAGSCLGSGYRGQLPSTGGPAGVIYNLYSSSEPFPDGIEQFGGGLLIENNHASTGGVRIHFYFAIAFGEDQICETARAAVHRTVAHDHPAIRVTLTGTARLVTGTGVHRCPSVATLAPLNNATCTLHHTVHGHRRRHHHRFGHAGHRPKRGG